MTSGLVFRRWSWEMDHEVTPCANLGMQFDPATVDCDDPARRGQAESASARLARDVGVEDLVLPGLLDARVDRASPPQSSDVGALKRRSASNQVAIRPQSRHIEQATIPSQIKC